MDVPREIGELMRRAPQLTLAVAESLTCGRVQARIGEVSGASDYFRGGITAYTLEQKVRHLGVERLGAAACECVSAAVAGQMARGVAALFGADLGVATTGFSEPVDSSRKIFGAEGRKSDTAALELAEPFAFWAVAWREPGGGWGTRTGQVVCLGAQRTAAQALVADVALAELLAQLRAMRAAAA